MGIVIKLSFEGDNQIFYPHTWAFVAVVVICGLTQMNYLNKVGFPTIFFYQSLFLLNSY